MHKTKVLELIEFNELSEEIQNKIIINVIQSIIDTTDFEELNKNTNLYKAYRDCNKMRTPWFLGQYIWDYCKKRILKQCRNWLYSKDGIIMESK